MNKEHQRIKIAEACGWDCDPLIAREWKSRGQWARKTTDDQNKLVSLRSNVPDYLSDLNAMHEAEKILSQQQARDYAEHLGHSAQDGTWAGCHIWYQSAAQRAEAFLRTLNLWQEGEL
jgi:hypothetical protein